MALSLAVDGLHAGYGAVKALRGVTLHVKAGETVALLGTNGNGKSTLIKCIMGLVRPERGSVSLTVDGRDYDLTTLSPEGVVDLGVALVPEGRRLFPKLTVAENLMLGAFRRAARSAIRQNLAIAFETFPALQARQNQIAGTLSGGQQQIANHCEDRRAQTKIWSDGADGGAEFQPGDPYRRPWLHHRPWRNRSFGRLRR